MSIMSEWYPGKVLIIDEKFEQVNDFISELVKKNVPVQYWNASNPLPSSINNIRIVLLDLDLTSSGLPRTNIYDYFPAADALSQIKGPHLILLLSTDYIPEDAENLKEAYRQRHGIPLSGFVDGNTGLTKAATSAELYAKIQAIISTEKVFEIILTWEKMLELAKDEALRKFAEKEFEKELFRFIKSLHTDFGKNSLSREFVGNMMRFVLRYMNKGSDFEKLSEILKSIDYNLISTSPDLLLSNLQMYHKPDSAEPTWTGDIFKLNNEITPDEKFQRYVIVLTPSCDFSQNNIDKILLCEGFLLDGATLRDIQHPLYKIFPKFKLPEIGMPQTEYDEKLQTSLRSMRKITPRIYQIWNFTEDGNNFFGVGFDFQSIKSVKKEELSNYVRVGRLDSPYAEDALQKYGLHSTRLGMPTTNSPHIEGQKIPPMNRTDDESNV